MYAYFIQKQHVWQNVKLENFPLPGFLDFLDSVVVVVVVPLCVLIMVLTFSLVQERPSTKVHSAPGGGSSLGYLFGGGGN